MCKNIKSFKNENGDSSGVLKTIHHHFDANCEQMPKLADVINQLRPVLASLREHHFLGIPSTSINKMTAVCHRDDQENIIHEYSCLKLTGRWLEERGFKAGEYFRTIALNGLLIICPNEFPAEAEAQAAKETNLVFGVPEEKSLI